MNFPKPWAEERPQSPEAALLQAARGRTLADSEREAIWARIEASLPVPGGHEPSGAARPSGGNSAGQGGAAAHASSAVGGAAGVVAAKGSWLALAVATVGVAGYFAWQAVSQGFVHRATETNLPAAEVLGSANTSPTMPTPPQTQEEPRAPSELAGPATEPIARDPRAMRHSSSSSAPAGDAPSALHEENMLLLEARAALRAGRANEAIDLLRRARVRFPNGALLQEREALSVEALSASGQRQLAAERADAFLRRFPRSPHAAQMRRYLAP